MLYNWIHDHGTVPVPPILSLPMKIEVGRVSVQQAYMILIKFVSLLTFYLLFAVFHLLKKSLLTSFLITALIFFCIHCCKPRDSCLCRNSCPTNVIKSNIFHRPVETALAGESKRF